MATTYLTRATADFGTATNRKKCTISFWVKRSLITSQQAVMGVETTPAGGSNEARIVLKSDDTLEFYDYQSTYKFRYITNRVFRDTSAWYHIVLAIDTTHPTGSARVKMYINGVEETSFGTSTDPAQNLDTFLNSGAYIQIGRQSTGNSYLDGSLSHYHFIDGTAYDASAFGETDTTTGEWKGKTSPSVTYGNNGFFILKDGNGITDQSGEGNDFTLGGGTLTDLKDNPENVFATLNAIDTFSETDYSNGNTKSTRSTGSYRSAFSTLGITTGKYYAEFKVYDVANGNGLGVLNLDKSPYGTYISGTEKYVGINDNAVGLFSNILYYNNVNQGGTWTSWSNGDIIGLAVDATNGYAYWSVNGTWQNSGNPTAGTGGYALSNIGSNGTYVMGCSNSTSSTEANFGNGYFGTTAVSSAGTNASDNGIFEYDVPTGYTALSTKGLNE